MASSAPTDLPSSPPPSRGPPDPAALKTRILNHMNADHHLSLRMFLQHYNHVPSSGTHSAKILDITPEHMILQSSYGRHVVAFEPPMKSLSEARERFVEMHNLCLRKLDVSDVVIKGYSPPDRLWQYGLSSLVLLIFATFPFRESLRPESGSVISKIWSVGGLAPWLAQLSYTLAPLTLGFIIVAHAAEAVWFANTKLRRHWVETGSVIWWCWIVDCMVEGVGSWSRFDRIVKKMEEKKPGGKH